MNRTGGCCVSAVIIIIGVVIIVIIAIATFVLFSMVVANFVVDICKLLASFLHCHPGHHATKINTVSYS